MFRFQQFTIHDDRCAMKVGTDGVLLGAWCQMPPSSTDSASTSTLKILDVGTGSGLVALMLAQRFPQTHITALELEVAAAQQAHENVTSSPFSAQVEVKQGDFLAEDWCPQASFDAIVSNPPYFEETLLSPNQQRAQARHVHHGLTFEALTQQSAKLLKSGGWLQVILPKSAQQHFVRSAQDQLILQENGQRSPQYQQLCADFYLTPEQLNHPSSPTAPQQQDISVPQ